VLVLLPKDTDVVKVYAAALLQSGQFQPALDALSGLPAAPPGAMPTAALERAYAMYRLNQLPAAQQLMGTVPAAGKTRPMLHLEAQIAYRLGQFQRAIEIYEKAFFPLDKSDAELLTNVMAAYVGAGQPEKAIALLPKGEYATYEVAYNAACALIDAHDLKSANRAIEQSKSTATVMEYCRPLVLLIDLTPRVLLAAAHCGLCVCLR
jgi:tetratricopeptide (TPR) repeat protein